MKISYRAFSCYEYSNGLGTKIAYLLYIVHKEKLLHNGHFEIHFVMINYKIENIKIDLQIF